MGKQCCLSLVQGTEAAGVCSMSENTHFHALVGDHISFAPCPQPENCEHLREVRFWQDESVCGGGVIFWGGSTSLPFLFFSPLNSVSYYKSWIFSKKNPKLNPRKGRG